jgi:hypothetical protein
VEARLQFLYRRHRVIEPVLNGVLRLHNQPKAEVHLGHLLTGPRKEEEETYCLHFQARSVSYVEKQDTTDIRTG